MYKILKLLILNLKPRYIISFTILCTNKSPPLSHTRNELLHCTKFKINVFYIAFGSTCYNTISVTRTS